MYAARLIIQMNTTAMVVVSEKYGIRITDIITPSERMRRLSR